MAEMNVRGNELLYELAEDLDYPIKKNGSLIVCTVPGERGKLDVLLEQAKENGVPGCRIIEKEEALKMEPNLTDNTVAALYVPTGGIICPWGLAIAMGENAAMNGCEFKFEHAVENIIKKDDHYEVVTNKGTFETKIVVNAAGVYADTLHNMVSEDKKHIIARRGEYLLMDKELGDYFSATVFPLPGKMGKGILCAPTIHGNMFVGPSATDVEGKDAVETTQEILDDLAYKAQHSYLTRTKLPMNKIITSFAGLRAHLPEHEFIIEEAKDAPGFFDALGIESPGLTAAVPIGRMVARMMQEYEAFKENPEFNPKREGIIRFDEQDDETKAKLIAEDPDYGEVICRCEKVTKAEILKAIHNPLGVHTMTGIKYRTRSMMGRCQGGYCQMRIEKMIEDELGVKDTDIRYARQNSWMFTGEVRKEEQ